MYTGSQWAPFLMWVGGVCGGVAAKCVCDPPRRIMYACQSEPIQEGQRVGQSSARCWAKLNNVYVCKLHT